MTVKNSQSRHVKTGHEELEAPWNASRCNRVLRPLASKLAALRRTTNIAKSSGSFRETTSASSRLPVFQEEKEIQRARPFGNAHSLDDPKWATANGRLRLKRKYGSHHSIPDGVDVTEGEAKSRRVYANNNKLPTPFVQKTRKGFVNGFTSFKFGVSSDLDCSKEMELIDPPPKRRHLSRATGFDSGALQAFFNAMEATRSSRSKSLQHSLFSTCLRKIPAFIKSESQWRKALDRDDKSDPAEEIYSVLEGFGTSESGWSGLRPVVRAHAISLMKDAIQAELMDSNDVKYIRDWCETHAADDVWVELMSNVGRMKKHFPLFTSPRVDSSTSQPTFSSEQKSSLLMSANPSWILRGMEKLVVGHFVCASYLAASVHADLWSDAKRLIICESEFGYIASTLMEKSLLLAAGVDPARSHQPYLMDTTRARKQYSKFLDEHCNLFKGRNSIFHNPVEPTRSSFLSICTVLPAAVIVAHSLLAQPEAFCSDDLTRPIRSATIDILRAYRSNAVLDLASRSEVASVAASVLVADLVVLINGVGTMTGPTRVEFIKTRIECLARLCVRKKSQSRAASISSDLDAPSKFLSSIAQCCAASIPENGPRILERTVDHLLAYSSEVPAEISLTRGVALHAALDFAEKTNDSYFIAYARDLEDKICGSESAMQVFAPDNRGSRSKPVPKGFRWEQGLCEWVAATPDLATTSTQHVSGLEPATSPLRMLRSVKKPEHDLKPKQYPMRLSREDEQYSRSETDDELDELA